MTKSVAFASTHQTQPLFTSTCIDCVSDDHDFQLVVSTGPIARGSVLLIEHVVFGTHADISKALRTDTALAQALHPRSPEMMRKTPDANGGDVRATKEVSEAEFMNAKIDSNAFCGPDGSMRLGPSVTRFNHSCDPNAIVRYVYEETVYKHRQGYRKDGFAVVYACKDISPGEEICYQYNPYAHDMFSCACPMSMAQRQQMQDKNAQVVGPPIFEANRSFLESAISKYLDDKEGTCAHCGNQVQRICTGCETVSYCNAVCQKGDWQRHKAICKRKAFGV
ncbi:Deformed epidermal autoregulatory factor 1 [Chytriomyces hyalinus]|nr:Deformed epidermal autoregulatory factor 1 [Chytriomyces hyalinus]